MKAPSLGSDYGTTQSLRSTEEYGERDQEHEAKHRERFSHLRGGENGSDSLRSGPIPGSERVYKTYLSMLDLEGVRPPRELHVLK